MPERRRHRRYKRRLAVKFGEKDFSNTGFTVDISATGAFISSTRLAPLGSRLHLQLFADDGNFSTLEAEVVRQKVVPHALRTVERGGFGVRFLTVDEVVRPLLPGSGPRFVLRYGTKDEFVRAYNQQLRLGGAFVATPKTLPRDAKVEVELVLEFAQTTFTFEASVVQTIEAGVHGIAVAFPPGPDDPKQLLAEYAA